MEYSQPLHAFDYDKLPEKPSMFILSTEGETLVTLDGEGTYTRKQS